MPSGWRKAFGMKMCEDLRAVLIDCGCLDTFQITQIKEKYGALRVYYIGCDDKRIEEILKTYEDLSKETCFLCGKEVSEPHTKQKDLPPLCSWCENLLTALDKTLE